MRKIIMSDLHVGKSDFAKTMIQKAIHMSQKQEIDVVLIAGDFFDGDCSLYHAVEACKMLYQIQANRIAICAGNNDIEFIVKVTNCDITEYAETLEDFLSSMRISLLDYAPVYINDTIIIGNMTMFNGSLWKASRIPSSYPNTWSDMYDSASKKFHQKFNKYNKQQLDWMDFYDECMCVFEEQLTINTLPIDSIVTHYVPIPQLLRYNHSAKYDYKNFFMGYDLFDQLNAKSSIVNSLHKNNQNSLPVWYCGHTHTPKSFNIEGLLINNVSGRDTPLLEND